LWAYKDAIEDATIHRTRTIKRTNDGGLSIGLTSRTEVEIRKEQVTATMEMDVIILMGT